MLDEVMLSCPERVCIFDKPPHGIKLMVPGEYKKALPRLPALFVFYLNLMNKMVDEVEHAVPGPNLCPEVIRRIANFGRRFWRISSASNFP